MLKCRQLCKVYRFYSIDIFLYLFEVTCFRCNLQTFLNVFSLKIVIFKREYLETEIFSDYTVEEKNAPFFLNFSNISFFHMVVNYWTGPLSLGLGLNSQGNILDWLESWIKSPIRLVRSIHEKIIKSLKLGLPIWIYGKVLSPREKLKFG